jgi:hypothetical protein
VKCGLNIDTTLQLSEPEVGTPIQRYVLTMDALEKADENSPIKAIVIPSDCWYVPIYAHGKTIYIMDISRNIRRHWQIEGSGNVFTAKNSTWDSIRTAWPESSRFNPIYIETFSNHRFFHFPQKGDHNLLCAKFGFINDSLEIMAPRGYDTLQIAE